MQKLRTGEMLRRFRIEKEATADKLGNGICGGTVISNYEVGNRDIDTLLFEFFLERMGVSPESFAFMLTEEEYDYYMWKAAAYNAVEVADWNALEKLLLKEEALFPVGNEKIQKQFYLYMKAIVEAEKYSHYEIAADHLLCAVKQTIQDISHVSVEKQLLSVRELHMIILYLNYGLCADIIETTAAEQMFRALDKYMLASHLDISEKTKIYPKLISVWINHQKEYLSDEEQICMCKQAIQILKEGLQFNDILEVIKIYISLLDEKCEEYSFLKKQYESFEGIFNYAKVEEGFRPEYIIRKIPKIYVITEYLKYKRKEMKLTQEKVSEGICEPETYSRIERGKRAPSPTNRKALIERLNIGWHYYRGELDTDSLEVYKLRKKHRMEEIKGNLKGSLEIVQVMKTLLDMDSAVNRQYIFMAEYNDLYQLGKLNEEEHYNKLEILLNNTVDINTVNEEMVYYTQTELEIIGDMAKALRRMNRVIEAIDLLDLVLRQMARSRVDLMFQWNGVDYIQRVLAGLYFAEGRYKEAYERRKIVYDVAIRDKDAGNLATLLDGMADDLEHIGQQYRDEYMKLYRLTYYVSDFYEIGHIKAFTEKYYEKFEKGYKWY